MLKKQRAQLVLERLNKLYPETPVPLNHSNHFELLVAVLLSAQCTDERVNQVTPALFVLGNTASDMQHVDVEEIYNLTVNRKEKKPFLLVCNTTKGKGVSFMENQPIWHYRSPTPDEYLIAVSELKEIGQ